MQDLDAVDAAERLECTTQVILRKRNPSPYLLSPKLKCPAPVLTFSWVFLLLPLNLESSLTRCELVTGTFLSGRDIAFSFKKPDPRLVRRGHRKKCPR